MEAGNRVSRERRFAFRLASALALVALAVFAIAELQPFAPRESLCAQAEGLGTARLLEKAEETFVEAESDDETCEEGERLAISRELSKAEKNFTAAAAFAATAGAVPAPAKEKTG